MKVMVATRQTQGARENDYNWCVEGELLWLQEPCGRGGRDPDGSCGCGRGFAGMNSHRATTTALVRELPAMTREDFRAALESSMRDQGWPTDCVNEMADELLEIADFWQDGDVIERRLDQLRLRWAPGSAPCHRVNDCDTA